MKPHVSRLASKSSKSSLELTQTSKNRNANFIGKENAIDGNPKSRSLEREVEILTQKLKKMEEQRDIDRAKLLSLQSSPDSNSTVKMSFHSIGDVDAHIAEQIEIMTSTLDNLTSENRTLKSKLQELQGNYDQLLLQNTITSKMVSNSEVKIENSSFQEMEAQKVKIADLEKNLQTEKEKSSILEKTNEQLQALVMQMESQLEQIELLNNYTETPSVPANSSQALGSDTTSYTQLSKQAELNINESGVEDSANICKLEQLFLKTYNALKKARTSHNTEL